MRIERSGVFLPFQDLHLAKMGALAPSCHNTQPWRFSIENNAIRIWPDPARRLSAVDPGDRSLYVSLGCATENIILAAEHCGLHAEVEHPFGLTHESVLLRFDSSCGQSGTELIPVMPLRQCIRQPFTGGNIPWPYLKRLARAGRQPGVELALINDTPGIRRIAEHVRTGRTDKTRIAPIAAELANWTRFNSGEAQSSRDGLLFAAMGYPSMPRCIGRRLVAALVRSSWLREKSADLVESSAALFAFVPERDDRRHWFDVGRSLQRLVLTAASLRIKYAHLQLPYTFPMDIGEVKESFGFSRGQEMIAVRLGYSSPGLRSMRRPVSQLLLDPGLLQDADQDAGGSLQAGCL